MFTLDDARENAHLTSRIGAVAQLGERVVRNDEVRGSIPLGSTIPHFRVVVAANALKVKVISAARQPDSRECRRGSEITSLSTVHFSAKLRASHLQAPTVVCSIHG